MSDLPLQKIAVAFANSDDPDQLPQFTVLRRLGTDHADSEASARVDEADAVIGAVGELPTETSAQADGIEGIHPADAAVLKLLRQSELARVNGADRDTVLLSRVGDHSAFPLPTTNYNEITEQLLRSRSGREYPDLPVIQYESQPILESKIEKIIDVLLQSRLRQEPGEPIPPQTTGPRFGLDPAGRITSTPSTDIDQSGNDLRRIEQLLPLVRDCVNDFLSRIKPLGNEHPALARDVDRYGRAIAPSAQHIDWGRV